MKHVHKSVLLWYSAQEMLELVTDVPRYPQFLPWCDRAEVVHQHADGVTAQLGLAFKGLRHAFTTRNTVSHSAARSQVNLDLVDGPFSQLQGQWQFLPLGPSAGHQRACKVEFDLRYTFASKALELLISPVFDHIANTFIDAFVARAAVVYGAR
jgi:ribosome-associated toxin RatA of RatAB toxin-antitoxin module